MPIISTDIMKIDERKIQKTTKEKQTTAERSKGNRSYCERVRAKWYCCAFKLGFHKLICKASKYESLYESKHVVVKCRCLKIWDLLSFLICSSVLVLKWQQVLPI